MFLTISIEGNDQINALAYEVGKTQHVKLWFRWIFREACLIFSMLISTNMAIRHVFSNAIEDQNNYIGKSLFRKTYKGYKTSYFEESLARF